MKRRDEHLAQAADDMGRVLDVLDAMHADTPEYAASIIDAMGIDRCCLASLRLLDVVVHLIATPGGPAADMQNAEARQRTTEQITEYIRDNITRGFDVAHTV